jgi:uncharacterized protein with von Willebrand factor type A (vWA) domain
MKNNHRKLLENTIKHDGFDRMAYADIYSQSKDLQEITEQGLQVLKTFTSLGEDVFFSLYKTNPELIEPDVLAQEYLLNFEQMAKLMESPSYQGLRQYTQLDELGAGLGCKALLETLVKQFQEESDLKDAADQVNEAIRRSKEFHEPDPSLAHFDQTMAAARKEGDHIKVLIDKMQSVLRHAMDFAASHAVGEVEVAESIITSWGFNKGEFARLPYAKKLELLQVLRSQRKFRDMTKFVGRMRNMAVASRKAKLQQRVELHAITLGDDINHVLPQELVALRKPVLKLDFYRRLMEKQLLQYDLNHQDPAGQGPIIALIDTSSSMRHENRETWSKAVALGLAEIAEKEKRNFAYALFASKRDELITDEFQLGQRSPEKVLRLAESFIGGGTNYEQPFTWAIGKLNESKFNKADIVLITDGEYMLGDAFSEELLKAKQEKQFRIYSILIGGMELELKRWSDEIWHISDLLDDSTVKEVFKKI